MLLIYGATGYTGGLIVRQALAEGLRPIIGGRKAATLAPLAQKLGVEYRAFALDDSAALDQALDGISVLLNCALPFAQLAKPLIAACVRTKTHYLDLAGQVPEFEAARAHDQAAQVAGVMVMPGVGFGIVPTDCVAAHLKQRLPSATHLTLAFQPNGGVSRGTLLTVLGDLPNAGVVRKNGSLQRSVPAAKLRMIDFGQGPTSTALNPWRGDISTAFDTTGIPNIETYQAYPKPFELAMRAGSWIGWLIKSRPVQALIKRLAGGEGEGPTAAARAAGSTYVWGEALDSHTGKTVVSRLAGPEAYDFSALTALQIVRLILAGTFKPGFQTPALVYGADFILELDGVKRTDG